MIDLHLHTTASDGSLAPAQLVTQALRAGITTLSVTDHDTTAGLDEASATAARYGMTFVPGIEITAVERGRDVHMLGYFFDATSRTLRSFLEDQRAERRRRIVEISARLADLGCPVDAQEILKSADGSDGRSVGRPRLADALVAAGYVGSRTEAFDLWLGEGRPACVQRRGADPVEVIGVIHHAWGIASLAHPGLLLMDDIIPGLVRSGLDAIEARHADHGADTEQRYRQVAEEAGLAVSGGSDFHGEDGRTRELGEISLPDPDFTLLQARASTRRR